MEHGIDMNVMNKFYVLKSTIKNFTLWVFFRKFVVKKNKILNEQITSSDGKHVDSFSL